VVREALATGAGSVTPFGSPDGGGVINGRMVERASGSRRVRNRLEACRYVLETWEEECREEEEASDEMEDESAWEGKFSVAVGLSVAVYEPLRAILRLRRPVDN